MRKKKGLCLHQVTPTNKSCTKLEISISFCTFEPVEYETMMLFLLITFYGIDPLVSHVYSWSHDDEHSILYHPRLKREMINAEYSAFLRSDEG